MQVEEIMIYRAENWKYGFFDNIFKVQILKTDQKTFFNFNAKQKLTPEPGPRWTTVISQPHTSSDMWELD